MNKFREWIDGHSRLDIGAPTRPSVSICILVPVALVTLHMFLSWSMKRKKGLLIRAFGAMMVLMTIESWRSVSAQFSYVGAEFGYSSLRLNGEGRNNHIESSSIRLTAIHRPFRHVGIGITYPIRLSQKVHYTPFGMGGYGGWGDGYEPTIVNDIESKEEFSGFVRIYADTRLNAFLDLRIRSYVVTQFFELDRSYRSAEYYDGELWYAAIPQRSFKFASADRCISPGIGMGISPHFGEHGFFSMQFEMDFIELASREFSMTIESYSGYRESSYRYKTVGSDLKGSTLLWAFTIGGGIFF